ncbi:IclR family transcriptional regulator [Nocardioides sp. LMS-CY]|uniref:IclR family transcriptional regulator n=1 Tax=Nocardioides sp. (strain LMS-CY) TaxID=2840457 RepID=UPI001C003081|nr:IclR family transcriptional regulator [Nocardioides sp. LMS-CY]QWF20530.1 IclR family transcriptional regulator [Nocardioides sp. LMS-CY]
MTASSGMQNATRVVQTIEYLAEHGSGRIEDIADLLGVHKSSASRLLATLRTCGWVVSNPSRTRFTLGPRLVRIGQAALPEVQIERAIQLATDLRELTDETVHVSVPDPSSHQMVVVARVDSKDPLRVTQPVGSFDPLHSTAVGKVYLASLTSEELEREFEEMGTLDRYASQTITSKKRLLRDLELVRSRGYALNLGESRLGIAAAAVLLRFSEYGSVVALSITGPASRWTAEAIESAMPSVLKYVDQYRVRFDSDS